MKPELRNKLLLALALAPETSDDDLETAFNTYLDKLLAEKEAAKAKQDAEEEEEKPVTAPAANDKIAADLTAAVLAANTQATALRELRAEVALDSCISLGIISPANRDAERALLLAANDEATFAEAITTLRKRKPVIKTGAVMAANLHLEKENLLAANSDHERTRLRKEKVDAAMAEITASRPRMSGDYERASAIAAQRFPELFSY